MSDRNATAAAGGKSVDDTKDSLHYLIYFFYVSILVFLALDLTVGVMRPAQAEWGIIDLFALFLIAYFLVQWVATVRSPPEWSASTIVFAVLEVLFMWWLFALVGQMEKLNEFGLMLVSSTTVYFYFILCWALIVPVFSRVAGHLEGGATVKNDKSGWALTILALIAAFTPLVSFPDERFALAIVMAVLLLYLFSFTLPVLPAVLAKILPDG